MPQDENEFSRLEKLDSALTRFRDGDASALDDVITFADGVVRTYVRKTLDRDFPRLRRRADSDDVTNATLYNLCVALKAIKPESLEHFLRLARRKVLQTIKNEVKRTFRPDSFATRHYSDPANVDSCLPAIIDLKSAPGAIAGWDHLHEAIDKLPDELRHVMDLYLWSFSASEIAEILGVTRQTVHKRRLKAIDMLAAQHPDLLIQLGIVRNVKQPEDERGE